MEARSLLAARTATNRPGGSTGRALPWLTAAVSTIAFPRRQVAALQTLAASVLERRGAGSPAPAIARELLAGFYDVCMRAGQDGVLEAVAQAFAPLDVSDASGLSEEPRLHGALVAALGDRARFDPRGPRTALPGQLVDCLLATLSLTPEDPPDRGVALGDEVRRDVTAALAAAVEGPLEMATLRAAVIASARARCDERYFAAFEKIAKQLDERGLRVPTMSKMPLDAVQAVQRALYDARIELVTRAALAAIDRARQVLAAASPEAAARIDQPLTHRLTPREVAARRAAEVEVPRPEVVVQSLLASLTELLELTWSAREVAARAYGIRETFAVGDVIDHPKFGRGTVKVATPKQVEVEFADGTVTLIHARGQ